MKPSNLLDWIDNIRTAVIFLVVNVHACVTYSHVGSWYYNAPPAPGKLETIPFMLWLAHLQSFFMGLLFFVGGYFADRSLQRRGAKSFFLERLRRLGIPVLIYIFVLDPLIVAVMHPGYEATPFLTYIWHHLPDASILGHSGPMWFALALLIFSIVLALFGKKGSPSFQMTTLKLVAFCLSAGLITFAVRQVQPVGTSILNMQFCFFTQYVMMFAFGVFVSRANVMEALACNIIAKRAGLFGIIGGPILFLTLFISLMPKGDKPEQVFMGGWHVQALAFALWEQTIGVCLSLGALWLFSHRFAQRTDRWTWLSERSFAVYLIHAPVLVAFSLLVQPIRGDAIVMSIVATIATLVVSFLLADILKRVPVLKLVM